LDPKATKKLRGTIAAEIHVQNGELVLSVRPKLLSRKAKDQGSRLKENRKSVKQDTPLASRDQDHTMMLQGMDGTKIGGIGFVYKAMDRKGIRNGIYGKFTDVLAFHGMPSAIMISFSISRKTVEIKEKITFFYKYMEFFY
jgi:hypothetical protein